MIPKEILLKACEAYDDNIGFRFSAPLAMEAALEAVLPDVWDEGYDAGSDDENAHQRGVSLDELNQYTPNPYRKEGE